MTRWMILVLLGSFGTFVPVQHGNAPVDRLEGVHRSLAGRLLVASERLADPNFERTVVLLLAHDRKGAMGVVVNRVLGKVPARKLLARLGRKPPVEAAGSDIELGYGGPVGTGMGFVVHTADYRLPDSITVAPGVRMTSDPQILVDIATGKGPARYIAVLGYAGWAAGQLEAEIARGDWYVVDVDPELLFRVPAKERWQRARERYGVEL